MSEQVKVLGEKIETIVVDEVTTELKVLTNPDEIAKVKRLINRVAFSIYFRRRNVEQHKHELKAVEKIQRFLGSESNVNYTKTSKLWLSMGQTVAQHIDQMNKVIEEAKEKDVLEVALLESIKEHTYGDEDYDHDYFKSILPYADVSGDTEEFNTTLKAMMRESGFLPSEEPKKAHLDVEQVNAEPIEVIEEEEVKEETANKSMEELFEETKIEKE